MITRPVDNERGGVPIRAIVAGMGDDGRVQLMLGPATRMLWRSASEIHLELGGQSVVVDGLPAEITRSVAARTAPQPGPVTDAASRAALQSLAAAGYLWPRSDPLEDPARPPTPRLRGELAALSATSGAAAVAHLESRQRSGVEIHGPSRLAESLASVLAGAGVGRVRCVNDGEVRLGHATPGGLLPADEGRVRGAAADDAVHRAAPDVDTTPLPPGERPHLTVLAYDAPVLPERRDALHAEGSPYLAIRLGVAEGVVGPLVLPGLTSCLRCADLTRADRDPAWDALAAQLAVPSRYGPASAVALATTVTGIAALQVLSFLDGGEPAVLEGTLELHLPDWRLRRRSWSVHPDCSCTAESGG